MKVGRSHIEAVMVMGVLENEEIFRGLSTIKNAHEYTFYHSINVSILTILMGSRLQLDPELLNKIGAAAMLHDLGKLRVPQEILDKPTTLTDDEWRIMKSHSIEGAKLLSEQQNVDPLALIVAAQHHAKHDLSGYPRFNGIDRLHIVSEVVAIADVFDALTSDRSYRKAMLPDKAMQIIAESRGTGFEASFVRMFAKMVGLFPVGTMVELDTGELALVTKANPDDLCRPVVRLVDPDAKQTSDPVFIDLMEVSDFIYKHSIVRSIESPQRGAHLANAFL